jgi:phage shock protein PspC (stress-responsive transcriptional regulator)
MFSSQPFARNDTLLGVCQSLGDDLGFNPIYLRILFGASLIWNPLAVIALYFGLAVVIALANALFPSPRVDVDEEEVVAQPAARAETRVEAPAMVEPLAQAA